MSPNPSNMIPGHITVEQTVLWQAGIQWLNATMTLPPIPIDTHNPPVGPSKKDSDPPAP